MIERLLESPALAVIAVSLCGLALIAIGIAIERARTERHEKRKLADTIDELQERAERQRKEDERHTEQVAEIVRGRLFPARIGELLSFSPRRRPPPLPGA